MSVAAKLCGELCPAGRHGASAGFRRRALASRCTHAASPPMATPLPAWRRCTLRVRPRLLTRPFSLQGTSRSDSLAILASHGLPGHALPAAFADAAATLGASVAQAGPAWPTLRESASAAHSLSQLLHRGWSFADAAAVAWKQAYARAAVGHAADAAAGAAAFAAHLAPLLARGALEAGALVRPLEWPLPLRLDELASGGAACALRREGACLEAAAGEALSALLLEAAQAGPEVALAALQDWRRRSPAVAAMLPGAALQALALSRPAPLACGAATATPADAGAALNALRVAAELFAQNGDAAGTRARWLRALAARLSPPDSTSVWIGSSLSGPAAALAAAAATAALLAEHPAVGVLQLARQRAVASRCALEGTLLAQPADPDCCVTSAEEEAHEQAGDADERAASCAALVTAESLLAATAGAAAASVELHRELHAAQAQPGAGAPASHLALCLARAGSAEERVRRPPAHPSFDVLPQALHAAAAVEAAALRACCASLHAALGDGGSATELRRSSRTVSAVSAQLLSLGQWRHRALALLAAAPASGPAPAEALLLAWLRLRKPLARLCSALSSASAHDGDAAAAQELLSAAAHAADALDASWGISTVCAPKPLLWRRGGHPLLPGCPETAALELHLRALCDSPALPQDPQLRAALAQAACFFSWAHVGSEASSPQLSAHDARLLFALARDKAAASAALATAPEGGDALDAPSEREVGAACDSALSPSPAAGYHAAAYPWRLHRWPAAAGLARQLRDTCSVASRRSSLALLAALTPCDGGAGAEPPTAAASQHAAQLLAFSLGASGQRLLDAAPLQQLQWLSERAGEDPAAARQLAAAVPAAAHELWFRLHCALWAPREDGAAQPAWADGVSALFRPALSLRLAALADGAAGTAVSHRAATLLQLRLAARAARCGASLGAGAALPHDHPADADRRAVAALAGQLLFACALRWPGCGEAASELEAGRPERAAHALARADCGASHLLAPLLAALAAPAAPRGSPACEASRGAAWTTLGCARLTLLAAELVADPAARDAFKLAHLRARRLDDVAPALALRDAAAQLPGAAQDLRARRRTALALDALDAASARLAARAVPRPVPSAWTAARSELERFAAGLGCVSHPRSVACPRKFCCSALLRNARTILWPCIPP